MPASTPLRVALLTPRFWPEVRRGTERYVHDLARGLIALGHRPLVVTTAPRPGRGVEEGVPVLRLPRAPERPLLRAGRDPHALRQPAMRVALARLRPDVAHAFDLGEALAATAWARRSDGAAVYTHMGIPDAADLALRPGRLRRTLRIADGAAVLTLSAAAAAAYRASTGRDARAIAPGVDLARFPLGTERTPQPTVVCAADAREQRKRVALLVDAWPRVREAHPQARLLLDRRSAGTFAAAPGVELADLDDTAELATRTGRAWAAVLPSEHEAFGLVLLEALATGTPVVAAEGELVDRPGIGRRFHGGAGELAEAILAVLALAGDPTTRGACRARAEELRLERTVAAHAELYTQLVYSRKRR
ncbi:MAG TPA: glycosyltransferase family 4 protein [Solirubrobacteraceae bacterium]|nr:glycosyltransferase family 4 protein [Solirubrobacteraceae bacterium]